MKNKKVRKNLYLSEIVVSYYEKLSKESGISQSEVVNYVLLYNIASKESIFNKLINDGIIKDVTD